MPDLTPSLRPIAELVTELDRAGPHPKEATVRQLLAHGAAAVPSLLHLLQREDAWEVEGKPEAWIHAPVHAFHLLGAIGDPSAAPALIDVVIEEDLDDYLTETAAGVLGSLGPGAVAPLIAALSEREIKEPYARLALARGLVEIALRHPEQRAVVTAVVLRMVRSEQDPTCLGSFLGDAVLFDDPEVQAAIDEAYALDRVNTWRLSFASINALRQRGLWWQRVSPLRGPLTYFEWVGALRPSPSAKVALTTPASPPKVGRNDPCPCGSGKKFKKCCGA